MTQTDVRFLQRLHEAHKREIQRDCKARKLDKGIYYARVHAAEKTAQNVLQSMMCRGLERRKPNGAWRELRPSLFN